MKEQVSIRQEDPGDYSAVYQINEEAFGRQEEPELVQRLRLSEEFVPELSLVAENEDGLLTGHILFTEVLIEGEKTHRSLALAPMAVLPSYQRSGIGSKLIKSGLSKAQKLGYSSIIVLGHGEYYTRFGFQPASLWGIRCPFEVPDDAFMALELQQAALEDSSGVVKYSPAFNIN